MNKPASELIALADDLSFAAENTQGCLYSQRKMLHAAADALRTTATPDDEMLDNGKLSRPPEVTAAIAERTARLKELQDRYKNPVNPLRALATPPAQPAPAATHGKPDGAVREALRNLLDYAEQRECSHEATHRGGSIWTICDECGKEWADDRGGFIPYQEPKEITQARTALHSPKIAAAETSPGDVLAMKEALARAFCVAKGVNPDCLHQNYDDEPVDHTDAHGRTFHFGWRNQLHLVDAALPFIDRLDVKAEAKSEAVQDTWFTDSRLPVVAMSGDVESDHVLKLHFRRPVTDQDRIDLTDALNMKICAEAKSQEPEAVAWRVRSYLDQYEITSRAEIATDWRTSGLKVEPLYTHPTTKPEAPAVSVDAIARLINPRAFGMDETHSTFMSKNSIINALEKATAIAALIAGER